MRASQFDLALGALRAHRKPAATCRDSGNKRIARGASALALAPLVRGSQCPGAASAALENYSWPTTLQCRIRGTKWIDLGNQGCSQKPLAPLATFSSRYRGIGTARGRARSSPERNVDSFELCNALFELPVFRGAPSARERRETVGMGSANAEPLTQQIDHCLVERYPPTLLLSPKCLRELIGDVTNRQILRDTLLMNCIL